MRHGASGVYSYIITEDSKTLNGQKRRIRVAVAEGAPGFGVRRCLTV